MLRLADVPLLRCPICRGPLAWKGMVRGPAGGQRISEGVLLCRICQEPFSVERGVARLYREEDVRGSDRLLRVVYDGLPSVHDPLVRLSFPWAVGETEAQSRARYLARLQLEALDAPEHGLQNGAAPASPLRILEVGAGTGSNLPLLRQRTTGKQVELWAVDLSLGMLRLLERRLRFHGDRDTRFLAGDAHTLPFPDHCFDRVFHVGAVNSYRDPARGLAEMARVARPGTPIVVVDERLDPGTRHSLLHRLFFKWMTIYDRDPHAPVEHLPAGATGVEVEQLGRFFYCLRFSMPVATGPGTSTSGA